MTFKLIPLRLNELLDVSDHSILAIRFYWPDLLLHLETIFLQLFLRSHKETFIYSRPPVNIITSDTIISSPNHSSAIPTCRFKFCSFVSRNIIVIIGSNATLKFRRYFKNTSRRNFEQIMTIFDRQKRGIRNLEVYFHPANITFRN
jgi:hypothetical protein